MFSLPFDNLFTFVSHFFIHCLLCVSFYYYYFYSLRLFGVHFINKIRNYIATCARRYFYFLKFYVVELPAVPKPAYKKYSISNLYTNICWLVIWDLFVVIFHFLEWEKLTSQRVIINFFSSSSSTLYLVGGLFNIFWVEIVERLSKYKLDE